MARIIFRLAWLDEKSEGADCFCAIFACYLNMAVSATGQSIFGTVEIVANAISSLIGTREWRRDRDSNPGGGFPPTRVPGVRLRPLGHLSVARPYSLHKPNFNAMISIRRASDALAMATSTKNSFISVPLEAL